MKKIFSELKGFVIYNPELLSKYLQENNLQGNDILQYFVETEHGDVITASGIAIPIVGVIEDYYAFNLSVNKESVLNDDEATVLSEGWVFQSTCNQLKVVGIGYLKDISLINDDNCTTLTLDNGWYSMNILTGFKDGQRLFDLNMQQKDHQPEFYGDVTTEYYYH
ncbi:hypothetical protein CHRYSEOSP005_04590 [Chryseobacterium sp. Alg-005]|uniref:hypothetical protein n=1 Tax=Chryseobacterium sp. Alg-005 TaxID=3159516 RepID=UPI003555AC4C